jgi:hypothetical protein
MGTRITISQILEEERSYMRGLSSIWQTDIVDTATATAELIEREVIEVDDDTIEVETN